MSKNFDQHPAIMTDYILTIVYFSDLQKEKIWNTNIIRANYFVLLFLSLYGIFCCGVNFKDFLDAKQ